MGSLDAHFERIILQSYPTSCFQLSHPVSPGRPGNTQGMQSDYPGVNSIDIFKKYICLKPSKYSWI